MRAISAFSSYAAATGSSPRSWQTRRGRPRPRVLRAGFQLGVDDLLELVGGADAPDAAAVHEEGRRGVDTQPGALLRGVEDRPVVLVRGQAGLERPAVEAERRRAAHEVLVAPVAGAGQEVVAVVPEIAL